MVVLTRIPPEMWRFLASQGGKRALAWSGAGQVLGRAYRRQRSSLQLPIHSLTHSLIHSVTHSFIHSFLHSVTHSFIQRSDTRSGICHTVVSD